MWRAPMNKYIADFRLSRLWLWTVRQSGLQHSSECCFCWILTWLILQPWKMEASWSSEPSSFLQNTWPYGPDSYFNLLSADYFTDPFVHVTTFPPYPESRTHLAELSQANQYQSALLYPCNLEKRLLQEDSSSGKEDGLHQWEWMECWLRLAHNETRIAVTACIYLFV
jgi:hypothetical protein